jgi:hypothetical protein
LPKFEAISNSCETGAKFQGGGNLLRGEPCEQKVPKPTKYEYEESPSASENSSDEECN